MTDKQTGALREDILDEKALTAILEGIMQKDKLDGFLDALEEVSGEINTVMSVALSSRVHEDGSFTFEETLKARGMAASTNGKVNIGLGRR